MDEVRFHGHFPESSVDHVPGILAAHPGENCIRFEWAVFSASGTGSRRLRRWILFGDGGGNDGLGFGVSESRCATGIWINFFDADAASAMM